MGDKPKEIPATIRAAIDVVLGEGEGVVVPKPRPEQTAMFLFGYMAGMMAANAAASKGKRVLKEWLNQRQAEADDIADELEPHTRN